MLSRRVTLAGLAAGVAAALTGCRLGPKDISYAAGEAANAVPGVTSAGFQQSISGTFRTELTGSIGTDVEDRASGLRIFDEAMRAVITVIHAELPGDDGANIVVGWIEGYLNIKADPLTILDLFPDLASKPGLDTVAAGSLYAKYGLQ